MDSFSLDTLEASLTSIQIQKHFREFDYTIQKSLLSFLKDEFYAFDDEFSVIVEEVLTTLEQFTDLETKVDELLQRFPSNKVSMVLQATMDYIQDVYYD
jgi:hypothetical protein